MDHRHTAERTERSRAWRPLSPLLVLFVALLGADRASATPIELIHNGGFESGSLEGWTSVDVGARGRGSYFSFGLPNAPLSHRPTAGPASGSYYAVSDQKGPGAHVLAQAFSVEAGDFSATLSFDMFVNDWSELGGVVDPNIGLGYSGYPANQHARVDVLLASVFEADPFATGPDDILANFYFGVDPVTGNPNPYTSYEFDLADLLAGGGDFVLRFGEVDNMRFLNQGIDNVSLLVGPEADGGGGETDGETGGGEGGGSGTPTPEPGAAALFGAGALVLALARRDRRP